VTPSSLHTEDLGAPPGWSAGRRRLALTLLVGAAILNLVDRQVISILLEPIKHEFQLSDTQIGLLTGTAFALCYALIAFPMARMLDRGVRRTIYAICIGVWSVSTMLAGMASSFAMLLLTRLGVAVGESSAGPAQQSLVADLYPGAKMPWAMALVNLGAAIGVALSLFLGGWLSQTYGWRMAFLVLGAPGLLIALGIWLAVPEPPRRTVRGAQVAEAPAPIGEVARALGSSPTYLLMLFAIAGSGFSGFALLAWGPSFLIRVHHMPAPMVGLWSGFAAAMGFGLGSLLSGQLGTVLGRRDIRWHLRLGGICNILAAPAGVLMAFSPTAAVAIGAQFIYMLLTTMHVPLVNTMVQSLAPPRMRAASAATTGFVQTIAGVGMGPLLLGVLNDAFRQGHGVEGIRLSLAWVMPAVALAGVALLAANRWAPSEYARAATRPAPDEA